MVAYVYAYRTKLGGKVEHSSIRVENFEALEEYVRENRLILLAWDGPYNIEGGN